VGGNYFEGALDINNVSQISEKNKEVIVIFPFRQVTITTIVFSCLDFPDMSWLSVINLLYLTSLVHTDTSVSMQPLLKKHSE
jgi:hypothetical protein